jgi:signal transduction histidine kinase
VIEISTKPAVAKEPHPLLLLPMFAWAALSDSGLHGQGYYAFAIVLFPGALLFGWRSALVLTLGALGVGAFLAWYEVTRGLPPPLSQSLSEAWTTPVSGFMLVSIIGALIHDRLVRHSARMEAQTRALQRTTSELETEIKLRHHAQQELSDAYARAVEGSQVKTAFLANMSHELRTPMNAVVGLTDLVLRDELTPSQREALETVRESSEGLLVLLNDLLDLSKIEAGAMRLEAVDFLPREVLAQQERLLLPRARARGLELTFHCAPDVPKALRGDPLRLGQVLTNLIGNGLKFTESGGVHVDVSWSPPGRERGAHLRSGRHRHRHDRRAAGPALPALLAGRPVDDPPLRRHGPGAHHRQAPV